MSSISHYREAYNHFLKTVDHWYWAVTFADDSEETDLAKAGLSGSDRGAMWQAWGKLEAAFIEVGNLLEQSRVNRYSLVERAWERFEDSSSWKSVHDNRVAAGILIDALKGKGPTYTGSQPVSLGGVPKGCPEPNQGEPTPTGSQSNPVNMAPKTKPESDSSEIISKGELVGGIWRFGEETLKVAPRLQRPLKAYLAREDYFELLDGEKVYRYATELTDLIKKAREFGFYPDPERWPRGEQKAEKIWFNKSESENRRNHKKPKTTENSGEKLLRKKAKKMRRKWDIPAK